MAANIRIEFRLERNLADFFDGGDILKPQILQITLIFNKLQILRIVQIKFLMRKRINFYGLADAREKFTHNLL